MAMFILLGMEKELPYRCLLSFPTLDPKLSRKP